MLKRKHVAVHSMATNVCGRTTATKSPGSGRAWWLRTPSRCSPLRRRQGKTTLLSLLLDRRREGGQLLGRTVRPAEPSSAPRKTPTCGPCASHRSISARSSSSTTHHREPSPRRWRHFIDHLLELAEVVRPAGDRHGDELSCPRAQNNPRPSPALDELRVVCGRPAGVLLLHQARAARDGSCSRPLDRVCRHPHRDAGPALRRLQPASHLLRRRPLPRHAPAGGRRAEPRGNRLPAPGEGAPEAASPSLLESLRRLLSQSETPLTRQDLLARWPQGEPPRAETLWRALTRGCEQGVFIRSGEGTKTNAFRYALAQARPSESKEERRDRPKNDRGRITSS